LKKEEKELEARRLSERVNYDLEMIKETGYVNGIENYSRYFDNREPGDPPFSLLDYFPKDYLLIIDESHMTIPQVGGMYRGDASRKKTLVDFGFRLPAAFDNRPLKFEEFLTRKGQTIYTSATPAEWETKRAKQVVEQVIRPTGLLDPEISIRPTENQIEDLIEEVRNCQKTGERVLITTLTKRMSEDLASYLLEAGIKAHYLHSEVQTLDRQDILDNLRLGEYEAIVGINLLREGLDLPEVALVAILDADKEGFLRSETSLIQVMGRAARHINGRAIMYGDTITGSMRRAIEEVERRRKIQIRYNKAHDIVPKGISKPIRGKLVAKKEEIFEEVNMDGLTPQEKKETARRLRKQMLSAAKDLDFERAGELRDEIKKLFSE
ncbi:MAG: helicase-related protein, partial [bacterium]|nr:helicase-related protein [bacterium]